MNQQELFQNYSKGEWEIDPVLAFIMVDAHVIATLHGRQPQNMEANRELILMMKRETIDKGINPEGVEALIKELAGVLEVMNEDGSVHITQARLLRIKEALTAAKLPL